MKALTEATHGKFYCADTRENVIAAFNDIQQTQSLSTLAGVNNSMTLDFQNVEINGSMMSGGEVFSYVPVELGMINPESRTTILLPNNTRTFLDQSDEWNANNQLHFTIGTINMSETWQTTFRLKVKQQGLINLFNCTTSGSSFNDGTENLCIPEIYIISLSNDTPIGLQNRTLDVSDLQISGPITDSIPLQWNLNYTGLSTATETLSYSYNNGPWVIFDTRTDIPPSPEEVTHTAELNIQGLEGGDIPSKNPCFCT